MFVIYSIYKVFIKNSYQVTVVYERVTSERETPIYATVSECHFKARHLYSIKIYFCSSKQVCVAWNYLAFSNTHCYRAHILFKYLKKFKLHENITHRIFISEISLSLFTRCKSSSTNFFSSSSAVTIFCNLLFPLCNFS